MKHWMQQSVPNDAMWLSLCRSYKLLEEIRKKTIEYVNVIADEGLRTIDLEAAIFEWRVCLRAVDDLGTGTIVPTTVSGPPLHAELRRFTELSSRKRSYRVMETFLLKTRATQY